MRSTAIAFAALFSAALVTAVPSSSPATLEARCDTGTCDCKPGEFWWQEKSCCLPQGGLPSKPQCPSDRSCPNSYYWHDTYSCCVPENPNPPQPTCDGVFSLWDSNDLCCKQPSTPASPPSSSSCSKDEFFFQEKSCCLPSGGLPNPSPCPSGKSCPSEWYWHDTYSCCVPRTANPPQPTCGGIFSLWDDNDLCCKQPSPSTPPPSTSPGCSAEEFFWPTKSCCLPNGGPPTEPQCPSGKSCPSNWYWHDTFSCCVPKSSNPPQPTCGGIFSLWDDNNLCCTQPPPSTPPSSTPSCSSEEFFWPTKSCCLPHGGPPTTPTCPSGKSCPSSWYWHDTFGCCAPQNPNPPQPTCGGIFSLWDTNDLCCKPPGSPTNPPPSSVSITHRKKRDHARISAALRQRSSCPAPMHECPIPGTNEVECIDTEDDLHNCGGCSALNLGKDCGAIPHVTGVSCLAAQKNCSVSSCEDGFAPSLDHTTCIAVLVSAQI